ncbi:MAG: amidohydrolase family protein, partial [Dehalococcoidia bacterium]|nr:amidohydrolase family protein [Dehalococcoidia bacterium]
MHGRTSNPIMAVVGELRRSDMRELALVNGQVVTMEGQSPQAEGVLVRDGRVAFVGPTREVLARRGPKAEVVDLKGRGLLPGFIDTHVHLISTGLSMMGPQLESCSTVAQVLEVLAAEARRQPSIVKASGLEPTMVAKGQRLTRWELDRVIPDKLAYIVQRDGHSVVVNTIALDEL